MEESVTLVEWGEGKVEALADDRLEVAVSRPRGGLDPRAAVGADDGAQTVTDLAGADDGRRTIAVSAFGPRWAGVDPGADLG